MHSMCIIKKNQLFLKNITNKYTPTLQKMMGHSSINVSLTYLRGLEIAELSEEDMPVV